jgi:hypothetical protein
MYKTLLILFAFTQIIFSQNTEYYFRFKAEIYNDINYLTQAISIDDVREGYIYAYANEQEFSRFKSLGYTYEILPNPGSLLKDVKMTNDPQTLLLEWDSYPTYDAYIQMMNNFAVQYPSLCRIVNIGQTVQGRQLLFAVISDNVSVREAEPQFQYSSSMHGDETTGYVLMLRLINYLLTNYGTNNEVTNLVNNVEIWINPLANPDGTYWGGNGTVNGARRNNANNYDLNRNFPDPTNPMPTPPYQPETIAMMNIASANNFVLSANFHGGAEVVNYPWDTWSRLTADNNWWVKVSRQYADTVHVYAVPGYMTYLNNGITNGYAWYRVVGGRQDYMCYYQHGRECTIELSNTKLLPPAQLPAHWDYNWRSFMNYMKQTLYGIRGIVTDSVTGLPLLAKIFVNGYDVDSSEIYSDSLRGNYHRMIYTGTYTLSFSAPGYYTKTISNVYAKNDSTTILNVQLRPIMINISKISSEIPKEFKLYQNYPNPFNPTTKIKFSVPSVGKRRAFSLQNVRLIIYDILGREIITLVNEQVLPGTYEVEWNSTYYPPGGRQAPSGVYFYKLTADSYSESKNMILIK